ncbi:MAG TPA: lytic murein transglycosylase B [Gammaproteobacteria bacterium]
MSLLKSLLNAGRFAVFSLLLSSAVFAAEDDYRAHPDFDAFVSNMAKHGFTEAELNRLFSGVTKQQAIIDAITRPAESKDWHEYRPIFITEKRIEGGVEFWNAHADLLARAEREFGVDAEIIVAIIGIETFYGRITGSWRVIEALATLGFDYPPRGEFFLGELEEFLLLTREEAIDPRNVEGSYAGAMGAGQFISSSYRAYAVDFDKDGKRDLWNSWADVIGSVANYLSRHGWDHGEVIVVPAAVPEGATPPLQEQGMEIVNAGALRKHGVVFSEGISNDTEVRFVALQLEDDMAYRVGLNNFRVITRYNRSPLYAMAAVELARAIKAERTP